MKFEITADQHKQINEWAQEVHKEVIERQRKSMCPEDFELHTGGGKYPYYGAIGGGMTFSFTPTSLGTILVVRESITGKEFNATDYGSW